MYRIVPWIAVMLTLAPVAYGQTHLYRWVDAKGQVHFSDVPASPNARVISPGRPQPGGAAPRYSNAPAAPQSGGAPGSAADCAKLRSKLAAYRGAGKITETDALGHVRTFTDAEKKQLIAFTEARIGKACGAGPSPPSSAPAP